MRARIRNLSLGALAGVVLVAMLGAGGFPSRPKFQAVGINTPAPAQVGGLALVPSAPGGGPTITVAATAGNVARAEFAGNGNTIGVTGMLYGQDASNIGYVWNRSNTEVRFGTNNLHRGSVTAEGVLDFQGRVQSTVTASALFGSFHAQSSQPGVGLLQSSAAADNRFWLTYASGTTLNFSIWNDAGSVGTNYIAVTRTGTTVDTINLQATAVQANGLALQPTVTCTTACSIANLPIGGSAYIGKGTATLRNSTTTDTADPDLQFTSTPAGTYSYEWFIPGTAGSGSGLKGTVIGTSVTVAPLGMQICTGTGTVHSATSSPTGCVSNTGSAILSERGTATVSATTTMSVGWSQGTSTVNNSTVPVSSWFRITRIK